MPSNETPPLSIIQEHISYERCSVKDCLFVSKICHREDGLLFEPGSIKVSGLIFELGAPEVRGAHEVGMSEISSAGESRIGKIHAWP